MEQRNLTPKDSAELAEIDAAAKDVKVRRTRFFAKLRQRAYRARISKKLASLPYREER